MSSSSSTTRTRGRAAVAVMPPNTGRSPEYLYDRRVQVRSALALIALSLAAGGCGAGAAADPPGSLRTLPGAVEPHVTVVEPAYRTAPGYLFVAEKAGGGSPGGPLILDDRGRAVWYHQLPLGLEATDFRTQTYRGKPVLTWWQGVIATAGYGTGVGEVYDASYHRIAEVHTANGFDADLHELQLTPRGTALITAYHEVPADLSAVGGPAKGYALDCIVQEIDVATGRLVFEWHSIGHVPLTDSRDAHQEPARDATKKRPFDYFHVNSVADGPNGTLLVSARNTSTIYLIARDGHIVWRIGTARSDFGPPAAVKMRYQHDARLSGDLLSFFDNGGVPREEPYSRPTVLALDFATRTARVVQTFVTPERIASPFEGSIQPLPTGGALVGWGGVRKVTEFGRHGEVRLELELPAGDTYRAFRLPWHGDPGGRPAVALRGSTVYASWNGKLGIAAWRALAGPDAGQLAPAARKARSGLETAIPLPERPRAVAVEALDAAGDVLGTSPAIVLPG